MHKLQPISISIKTIYLTDWDNDTCIKAQAKLSEIKSWNFRNRFVQYGRRHLRSDFWKFAPLPPREGKIHLTRIRAHLGRNRDTNFVSPLTDSPFNLMVDMPQGFFDNSCNFFCEFFTSISKFTSISGGTTGSKNICSYWHFLVTVITSFKHSRWKNFLIKVGMYKTTFSTLQILSILAL